MMDWKSIGFKDINPIEVARQMTLLDSRIFSNIDPTECFRQRWMRFFCFCLVVVVIFIIYYLFIVYLLFIYYLFIYLL